MPNSVGGPWSLRTGEEAIMGMTQAQKGELFRALHARAGAFVIPNPWDAGTARILAGLGFEAFTTTSAGLAFSLGKRDGMATRNETLANAKAIVDATDLPVAADLENGFGDSPETAAETVGLRACAPGRSAHQLGSSLCRAALGAFFSAAREIREKGTFMLAAGAIRSAEVQKYMAEPAG